MAALKEIPVREKGRFILGRVRHHIKKPLDYEVKVIHRGKLKVVSYGEDVFLVDDRLAEEAIRRRWEEYVQKRYRRPGSRAKKEIVEHPVELDITFLRQLLAEKKISPQPFWRARLDLEEGLGEEFLRALRRAASQRKRASQRFHF